MTLFEVIIHLFLWPFNVAVYTYNVLALTTGTEPPINLVLAAGVVALLLGVRLVLRWDLAATGTPARGSPRAGMGRPGR